MNSNTPHTPAHVRISEHLQGLSRELSLVLDKIAGEHVCFSLQVWTNEAANYISNAKREDVAAAMAELLAAWKTGIPDVPAHRRSAGTAWKARIYSTKHAASEVLLRGVDNAPVPQHFHAGDVITLHAGQLAIATHEPNNFPLRATAADQGIDMAIAASVLRVAAEQHPDFWNGHSSPDEPNIKITDLDVFTREVASAINEEAEDGSTLLTRMIDEAVRNAVESGCEGVDHGC